MSGIEINNWSQHACHARSSLFDCLIYQRSPFSTPGASAGSNMPSQEYAPPEEASLSPNGSGNVNKRKAPEDNFAGDEEVFCPCDAGPCISLTSTKPHSQGRKFYRCPKSKEDGQCGFFQWQDQPPRKQQNQGEQQDHNQNADGNLQGPQTPECRCGLEAVEITSNSAANPGRVFYKCPKNEAEGRCKFFKWQDELLNGQTPPQQPGTGPGSQAAHQSTSNSQAAPSGVAGGSGVFADGDDDFDDNFGLDEALNNVAAGKTPTAPNSYAPGSMQQGFGGQQTNGAPPTSPGAQPPEILNCDCGLQCSYIMAKTAKNDGRWFYRCPKPKDEGQCRFFQWADELGQQPQSAGRGGGGYAKPAAGGAAYGGPAPGYHTYSSPPKMGPAGAAASNDACFKCGQTGHWSRDCPTAGGGAGGGGAAAGGGSCFKCGQEGHWARDCPNPSSGGRTGGAGGRGGGGGGRGPTYGGAARGYGGAQGNGGGRGGGAAAAPGACYKCGQSGHWTNSCPN